MYNPLPLIFCFIHHIMSQHAATPTLSSPPTVSFPPHTQLSHLPLPHLYVHKSPGLVHVSLTLIKTPDWVETISSLINKQLFNYIHICLNLLLAEFQIANDMQEYMPATLYPAHVLNTDTKELTYIITIYCYIIHVHSYQYYFIRIV